MSSFDLEIGQTVSHFRMEKKLGEGGMGAVYLAEDLTLSRRVAIKFMSRALLIQQGNAAVRESLEKRFVREAKSAAAINHPNLAQIYEANFDSDNWYIAMELIDGLSLYDLITEENRTFTVEEIVSVCRQVASGLDYAWENYTIVHRDIKPHNVMLTKTDLVKIVDLGLAKPIANDDTQMDMPDLTGAGTPIGTPQYMAPEQATGQKDIDFQVDIFALGATLYEICCGKKAFSGNTAPMIYMSQVQKKYTPLKELRSDLPDGLVNLIDHMLEPKPEDRIASYQEIIDALGTIPISGEGGGVSAAVTQQYSKTMVNQMSSKTMGIDQTMYHSADQLIKGRYRILKTIGKSRTGIEYHCLDTQLSVECSVKSIFPGREFPEHEMPRIKENFQRLMGLSHPNLVQIRDLTQDDETGEFFVVMETLPGHNLRDYTHKLKNEFDVVNVKAITPILSLIAKALDGVSKTFGIVDHDLTPENIYLIKNDTQIKLMDYGITYPSDEYAHNVEPKENFKFPQATPDYMAPELWQRKSATRQSDQYSLGVIVYEMLSDKLPFWLKDPIADDEMSEELKKLPSHEQQLKHLYDRVLNDSPKPLMFLKRNENAAILKALSKDPRQRYKSCEDFLAAFAGGDSFVTPGKVIALTAAAVIVLAAIAFPLMKKTSKNVPGQNTVAKQPAGATTQPTAAKKSTAVSRTEVPANESAASDGASAGVSDRVQEIAMAPAAVLDKTDRDAAEKAKLIELKTRASQLQTSYKDVREQLAQNSFATELLPQVDQIRDKAEKALSTNAVADGVAHYQEAIALANNLIKETDEKKAKTMLQVKNEAINLQKSFAQLYEDLSTKERLAEKLPEAVKISADAAALINDEKYAEAIRALKKAIDMGQDLRNELNQELQGEADELQKTVEEWREKLSKYKGLSADLTEQIVKVDVTISLARTELNKQEFDFAVEQYNKALEDCKAILTLAETKFRATLGQPFTDPKTGIDFVWIDTLKLWVSKFEVTNSQFRKYKPTHNSRRDTMSGLSLNGDEQPVVWITYYDAVGYCQWLSAVSSRDTGIPDGYDFRLPTRDEWMTLARCGQDRLYPWGNSWPPKYGNFGNQELFPTVWQLDGYTEEFPVTCSVKSSGENEWAVFGMAGNVWEWTTDLRSDKRAVMGGGWTDVNRSVLFISMDKAYASMNDSYDNIGIRILVAPASE